MSLIMHMTEETAGLVNNIQMTVRAIQSGGGEVEKVYVGELDKYQLKLVSILIGETVEPSSKMKSKGQFLVTIKQREEMTKGDV